MNLEQLLARAQEIDAAILNTTSQLNALHGHKAETMHWIQRAQDAVQEASTTQVEHVAETVVE
jgi:hypothetical protein